MPGKQHKILNLLIKFQTESSYNFILKHIKTAHKNGMVLNVRSKEISLLGFFYFNLLICPPDVKRPTFFKVLTPELPPRLHHEQTAELTTPPDSPPAFHNHLMIVCHEKEIRKLNLCSKTEISKTASINA